ncbi:MULTISPECIES: hypothetical protein [Serratia]|uniref:hypothetical protein n=1 Tax=Serratia TaxID=613 RepID=UPI00080BF46C|nr:hypothetical protein [Serratia sp. 506_PEND]
MQPNENEIYDAALARFGSDKQLLKTAEECSELAAAIIRHHFQGANADRTAQEMADVEIMLAQMRRDGWGEAIDRWKAIKLKRLMLRLGKPAEPLAISDLPDITALLDDAEDAFTFARANFEDGGSPRYRVAAQQLRQCRARLAIAAQHLIREAQRMEAKCGKPDTYWLEHTAARYRGA